MGEKKKIDRLFQEKFKDYEVFPNPVVWDNIEQQLMKRKKRRIVPLWLRLASAAAVLLLLFSTAYWWVNNTDNSVEQPIEEIITNVDENKGNNNGQSTKENSNNSFDKTEEVIADKSDNQEVIKNQIATTNPNRTSPKNNAISNDLIASGAPKEEVKTTISAEDKVVLEDDVKKISNIFLNEVQNSTNKEKAVADNAKTDIQEALEEDIIEADKDQNKKWSIGSTVAPVYFNTLSKGSPIDAALSANNKSSNTTLSYGLKVNYKINNKLSLQSGINNVELGYSTEKAAVLMSTSLLGNSDSNINTSAKGVSLAAISTAQQFDETQSARLSYDVNGSIDQSLGYIELPLEAKYNLFQRKVGLNVIGGFSTYVLYQNKIYQNSFGKSTLSGEASNLNSLNFSGNLGLDLDYSINKKLFINVSPMFKYQFNTFSESSGGFQPYFFGVYTGLNFRF